MSEPQYLVLQRMQGFPDQFHTEFGGSMADAIDHIRKHLTRYPSDRARLLLVSVLPFDAAIDVNVKLTFADGIHL